jgi:hypothetical protein
MDHERSINAPSTPHSDFVKKKGILADALILKTGNFLLEYGHLFGQCLLAVFKAICINTARQGIGVEGKGV